MVDVRPFLNLQAMTIEQVVGKMQASHLQLISMLADEFRFGGAPERALAPLEPRCPQLTGPGHPAPAPAPPSA